MGVPCFNLYMIHCLINTQNKFALMMVTASHGCNRLYTKTRKVEFVY